MSRKRKKHTKAMKARVALEAIKVVRTLSELSAAYGVHSTVIAQWKRRLVQGAPEVFCRGNTARTEEELTAPLYEEIGRLKIEIDWLKKTLSVSLERGRAWIEPEYERLSIAHQCELSGMSRSSYLAAAGHGERRESGFDAGHRPAVFETAVLRSGAHDRVAS